MLISFSAMKKETKSTYGPTRATREQAQKDLEQIHKAAEKAATREEGLEMMRNEAYKIK